ncbi:MAG TPA: 3-methyl-2-oxobutanoate hydroxymethyltransferase [Anaerolineae bacterium]|nr:3-methyl-2-oxobutanoate hydroxymethyltransferase [Anaerolineae bacterium]
MIEGTISAGTMITAYDYPTALLVDRAGIDMILVGDSLAMVVLGYENTLPVTMDVMIHHAQAVARGAKTPFLIGDMPFGAYEVTPEEAVRNAVRFLKEGGMDAVKLEGGREMVDVIRAIVAAGIPVQGHIGLTPQSISALGGFRVQGKTAAAAQALLEDALALQEAGCFSIVLEAVPAPVAEAVSKRLCIPTIGIGAGPGCDGQVLVFHDLVGLFDRFVPKFVKKYMNLAAEVEKGLVAYKEDVLNRRFPAEEHCYDMNEAELQAFLAALETGDQASATSARQEQGEAIEGLYGGGS